MKSIRSKNQSSTESPRPPYPFELLKQKRLKITPTRLGILQIFLSNTSPLSAEEIFDSLYKPDIPVDKVTIYRTLNSFAKAGIIVQVDTRRDALYYEIRRDHHHHIICTSCNVIEDIAGCDIPPIQEASKRLLRKSSFASISTHSLEFFGLCKKCARA